MAEREGFEPPVPLGITGFQDQRHKPLGHLSSLLDPAELLYDSMPSLSTPFFAFLPNFLFYAKEDIWRHPMQAFIS